MEKKKKERHIAINTHLFLALVLFIALISLSISSAKETEIGLSVGFALAALLPIFVFFFSPLYFVFSDTEVKIVYHFRQIEVISWNCVTSIYLQGSWIGGGGPPHYCFAYPTKGKRLFFVRGEIPKTIKTKKLIKKYYKKKIT